MNTKFKFILFISWTIIIMVIVGIPGSYIPRPMGFLSLISPDKIVHLFMFVPLSIFLLGYLKSANYSNIITKNASLFAFIYGIIYASTTELLQFYVFIGRNGNLYDAVADLGGAGIGIIIFNKWIKK